MLYLSPTSFAFVDTETYVSELVDQVALGATDRELLLLLHHEDHLVEPLLTALPPRLAVAALERLLDQVEVVPSQAPSSVLAVVAAPAGRALDAQQRRRVADAVARWARDRLCLPLGLLQVAGAAPGSARLLDCAVCRRPHPADDEPVGAVTWAPDGRGPAWW